MANGCSARVLTSALATVRGFTALHHAVRKRLPRPTLRLLVRCGADVHAAAVDGATVASLSTRAHRRLLALD